MTTIAAALLAHLRPRGGWALAAPMDVWFSDGTVLEPDVLAVLAEHVDQLEERRVVGPPDLVVEVSSPSTRRTDVVRKRRVYEREGVPEFWFVDLDTDQVQCYRRDTDGTYGAPSVVMADGELRSEALDEFVMLAANALVVAEA